LQIDGNTFFVTGAASGLGAASARMIVSNGGRVVLADIGDAGGTALAAELGGSAPGPPSLPDSPHSARCTASSIVPVLRSAKKYSARKGRTRWQASHASSRSI